MLHLAGLADETRSEHLLGEVDDELGLLLLVRRGELTRSVDRRPSRRLDADAIRARPRRDEHEGSLAAGARAGDDILRAVLEGDARAGERLLAVTVDGASNER